MLLCMRWVSVPFTQRSIRIKKYYRLEEQKRNFWYQPFHFLPYREIKEGKSPKSVLCQHSPCQRKFWTLLVDLVYLNCLTDLSHFYQVIRLIIFHQIQSDTVRNSLRQLWHANSLNYPMAGMIVSTSHLSQEALGFTDNLFSTPRHRTIRNTGNGNLFLSQELLH